MTEQSNHNQSFTLVVADIHLQPDATHPVNTAFHEFLKKEASKADALYILGDLFEMWVGDDIGLEDFQDTIQLLQQLTQNGLAIYLQYGNRDFLMRQAFFEKTGIQLLEDVELITLYSTPYLFLHGDTLCTDDKDYQRMRRWFRNRFIQWLFLSLSKKRRLSIGQKMRRNSKSHSQKKDQQIMDVSQTAVVDLFNQYPETKQMIHGHTHRPAHHTFSEDNQTLNRWVLGDWRPESQIIQISETEPKLIDYPPK